MGTLFLQLGFRKWFQMKYFTHSVIVNAIKVAATDMRYFTRSKFYRSLVHKENVGLI